MKSPGWDRVRDVGGNVMAARIIALCDAELDAGHRLVRRYTETGETAAAAFERGRVNAFEYIRGEARGMAADVVKENR